MPHEQSTPAQDPQQNQQEDQANNTPENDGLEYESFSDNIDPISQPEEAKPVDKDSIYKAKIAELEEKLLKTKDLMMRTVAEAENGRKRALKDREDLSKFAISKFSRDLLAVADNLRRALDAAPAEIIEQHPPLKNLTDGIEATERELLRAFDKNGIQKTDPMGEKFDPNFHEVMFEAPMPDKKAGEIIQVIEAGYILNGRILRPARVGIAKDTGETPPSPSTEPGQTIDTKA